MSDLLGLVIDGAEAHVLEAALAVYRGELHKARGLGGPATEAAALMDPIAARVQARLHDELYGKGEAVEPDWTMPEGADPITQAKGAEDYWRGDHHRYDSEALHHPNIEGDPAFNGALNRW
jgi:hypothetical protein